VNLADAAVVVWLPSLYHTHPTHTHTHPTHTITHHEPRVEPHLVLWRGRRVGRRAGVLLSGLSAVLSGHTAWRAHHVPRSGGLHAQELYARGHAADARRPAAAAVALPTTARGAWFARRRHDRLLPRQCRQYAVALSLALSLARCNPSLLLQISAIAWTLRVSCSTCCA